jgi:alpha/beta superfamily hydrolase
LIVHGDSDRVAPLRDVETLVSKLKTQKGIIIEQSVIEGANHFFDGKTDELIAACAGYLDKRLGLKGADAA